MRQTGGVVLYCKSIECALEKLESEGEVLELHQPLQTCLYALVNKFNIMNRIQCPVTDKKMKKTKKKLARVNQTGEMTE